MSTKESPKDATLVLKSMTHLSHQTLYNGVHWLIYSQPVRGSKDEVEIGATDGIDKLYRETYKIDGIKNVIGERLAMDTVVTRFKEAFQKAQLRLRIVGNKLQATISPDDQRGFDLTEVKAPDVKTSLQRLLFCLSERCMELRSDLSLAKGGDQAGASADSETTSGGGGGGGASRRPRRDYTKTSAINPGSRKRKEATGVEYD